MNRVREHRLAKGLNQRQLAEKLHVSASLLSSIELGRLQPWPKIIRRLCKKLDVSAEELFPDMG